MIHPQLIKHLIITVSSQTDRYLNLIKILERTNFIVQRCINMYDALAISKQDLPHLIITDSQLSDGNAVELFDRLQKIPILQKIPVMTRLTKNSKQEVEQLSKRKFSAIFLAQETPEKMANKVGETFTKAPLNSPFLTNTLDFPFNKDFHIQMKSQVVGRTNDLLVCKSTIHTDLNYSIVVNPSTPGEAPLLVKAGSNFEIGENRFNAFPIQTVRGPGRIWVEKLQTINLEFTASSSPFSTSTRTPSHEIIYYDKDKSRGMQICEFLNEQDIATNYTDSLRRVISTLQVKGSGLDAVYLQELGSSSADIEFREFFKTISPQNRPAFLIATTSKILKPQPKIMYIQLPFGLGKLSQALNMCFVESAKMKEEDPILDLHGTAADYNIAAKLVGIDEVGGVIQTAFQIQKDTKFTISFPMLNNYWSGVNAEYTALNSLPISGGPKQIWQTHFSVLGPTGSRLQFWQQTYSKLEAYLELLSQENGP